MSEIYVLFNDGKMVNAYTREGIEELKYSFLVDSKDYFENKIKDYTVALDNVKQEESSVLSMKSRTKEDNKTLNSIQRERRSIKRKIEWIEGLDSNQKINFYMYEKHLNVVEYVPKREVMYFAHEIEKEKWEDD